MKRGTGPNWAPWLFLAPFLVLFGLFTVWPLLLSLKMAFEQTFGPNFVVFVGLKNFRLILHDPQFWKALRHTVEFAGGSVLIILPLSLVLALVLNREGLSGRTWFRLIFFSPSLVGLAFVAMMFAIILDKHTGLVNVSLHALIPSFDLEFGWMDQYVMTALLLAAGWLNVGFNMIYFLAALQNVPRELVEAANIDGAGRWQRFRHVTLPAIQPVLGFVTILSLIGGFQLFELPWVMLDGTAGPDDQGLTVVMYLYQVGFINGDLGYASALGWVLSLILVAITLTHRQWSRRTEA